VRGDAVRRRASDAAFFLGMASLFTHELDAIPNHEWRGLPLLRALPDETAMAIFIASHVPLFAILIGLVASANPRTRGYSRMGIATFVVVHAVLHAFSMADPTYEFSSMLSNLLIFGGAAFGGAYLALAGWRR
jgi:hypothetical protein